MFFRTNTLNTYDFTVQNIDINDFNKDGANDILLVGNKFNPTLNTSQGIVKIFIDDDDIFEEYAAFEFSNHIDYFRYCRYIK